MMCLILAFLIYLLIVMWVQVDNLGISYKKAFAITFFSPFIFLLAGVPYFLSRGISAAIRWVWGAITDQE